jgi:hypothetical protein
MVIGVSQIAQLMPTIRCGSLYHAAAKRGPIRLAIGFSTKSKSQLGHMLDHSSKSARIAELIEAGNGARRAAW